MIIPFATPQDLYNRDRDAVFGSDDEGWYRIMGSEQVVMQPVFALGPFSSEQAARQLKRESFTEPVYVYTEGQAEELRDKEDKED